MHDSADAWHWKSMALFRFTEERLALEANLLCSSYSAQLSRLLTSSRFCVKLTSLELKTEACMVQLHTTGGNKQLELFSERKRSPSPRCRGAYVSRIQLLWITGHMIAMCKVRVYHKNVNMELSQCSMMLVNIHPTIF